MFIHGVDAGDESEWRAFLAAHPFGELVAGGGPQRRVPVLVPTQYVLDGDDVLIHLLARTTSLPHVHYYRRRTRLRSSSPGTWMISVSPSSFVSRWMATGSRFDTASNFAR